MDLSKLEEDAARAARDALNVDGTFDVRSPDECSLDDREQSEWDATVRATRAVLAIALAAAAEEDEKLTNGDLLLAAGEMTAGELRSVRAILKWRSAKLRSLAILLAKDGME